MTAATETTAPPTEAPAIPAPVPALDVVVPVHNEEADLESCLRRLHAHLSAGFPYRFRITVAENASTDGAAGLLPLVEDDGWFFDTELLVLAERSGLRIHEVPVDWVDDPDSRVDIVATALADLRGVVRVSRALATGAGRTRPRPLGAGPGCSAATRPGSGSRCSCCWPGPRRPQIRAWVEQNFTATTVGGTTVYKLTG